LDGSHGSSDATIFTSAAKDETVILLGNPPLCVTLLTYPELSGLG